MKLRNSILFCAMLFFMALCVLAQTNTQPTTETTATPSGLPLALIPVIVPLLVSVGKWLVPKLPSWSLPIIAPALGAVIDLINAKSTGGTWSPLTSGALGMAGVGLREIVDQVKQKIVPKPDAGS